VEEAFPEDAINFGGGGANVIYDRLCNGNVFLHAIESLVLAIVEGVVDARAGFLRLPDGCSNDVDDGGAFGVGTSDCVYGGEFADAEGCDEGTDS
jgi:hypothetical protein